ncbi:MAG TPA: chromate efflux transporter [Cytophagaceae bacterium]
MKLLRHYIFLKDVFILSITAFGGPQAHLALFFNLLVTKRRYLNEEELINLNSFCQILPGPASTQTITAVGFKMGGPTLAFLTLLVWIFPASAIMTLTALYISYLQNESFSLEFTKYIQPMAVALVIYAAFKITTTVVNSRLGFFIYLLSICLCFYVGSPAIFPIMLITGGVITSLKFNKEQKEEHGRLNIEWSNLVLYCAIFIGAALIGRLTHALPVRLFENFFRNGSLIFGGGHTLSALLYKEFVTFKEYLTAEEFLSGFAVSQILPGPLFSFSAFVGAMSMQDYGVNGQVIGAIVATAGIFLPGTILIFFVIRFWDRLKKYRIIKASLQGVNCASAGIVTTTAIMLFQPLHGVLINYIIVIVTLLVLHFTKFPPPLIILVGLIAGFIF